MTTESTLLQDLFNKQVYISSCANFIIFLMVIMFENLSLNWPDNLF